MKKYSILEDLIKKEFKTLGVFSRESGIPKSTLSMLINGKYGNDESRLIRRIDEKLKEMLPNLDLNHIWSPSYSWYQKFLAEKSLVRSGFKITVYVQLDDEGRLSIAPSVEGY